MLEWPSAQVACRLNTVVEQDSIKSLNKNKQNLENSSHVKITTHVGLGHSIVIYYY